MKKNLICTIYEGQSRTSNFQNKTSINSRPNGALKFDLRIKYDKEIDQKHSVLKQKTSANSRMWLRRSRPKGRSNFIYKFNILKK